MLMPLIEFVLFCIVFSITGVVLNFLVPDMEFSWANLLLFLVGAFPGHLLGIVAYGLLTRHQPPPMTAPSFLMAVYVGGVIGGLVAWLIRWIFRRQSITPPNRPLTTTSLRIRRLSRATFQASARARKRRLSMASARTLRCARTHRG